jgi:ribosomal protein S18 acetylase RimI-like enzyme
VTVRSLTAADLPSIRALEAEAYVESLLVSDEAFLRLIHLFPAGAIGAFDADGLCGFIFGLPLTAGTTLDLREPLDRIPEGADTFYVHDIAVARRCRGRGVGRSLATRLLEVARAGRFTRAELVSVQGSAPFWEKLGFSVVRECEYGEGEPSLMMRAALVDQAPQ